MRDTKLLEDYMDHEEDSTVVVTNSQVARIYGPFNDTISVELDLDAEGDEISIEQDEARIVMGYEEAQALFEVLARFLVDVA